MGRGSGDVHLVQEVRTGWTLVRCGVHCVESGQRKADRLPPRRIVRAVRVRNARWAPDMQGNGVLSHWVTRGKHGFLPFS